MIKKVLIFAILLLAIIAGIWLYIFPIQTNPYTKNQEDLASKLGVRIKDYPFEADFPAGYFYNAIKPGMTVNDVHNIVHGYEKVLRCHDSNKNYYFSEIYYYFGSGDDNAIRFELFFDKQGRFEKFQGEDQNSRSIMTFGCEEGVIQN